MKNGERVIGDCPYCGRPFCALLIKAGSFTREKCDDCGLWFWLYHSRIVPLSFNIDEVAVDENSKTVIGMDDVVKLEIAGMYRDFVCSDFLRNLAWGEG